MNRIVLSVIATLVVSSMSESSLAQKVSSVQFARGASSAVINGTITGEQFIDYRVVANAGQRMSVTLRTSKGSPYFNVMEPGSTDVAIYNSSTGEPTFSGVNARSGPYVIRVYQMRASGRRGEVASYQLSVAVTGSGPGPAKGPTTRSGDALVSGTPYHATASIRCRSAKGAAMSTCQAGVMRRSAGSATVHLDTPDGGERTILFREGSAVSSDAGDKISVKRVGDNSIVFIGTVEEYDIPDALIFGG